MNSSAHSPCRHWRHTTYFGKPQSIMPVVPRAGGKLPCLGADEEFTGLIFSDSIQNSSYVCKIAKVHNLNSNPFRTLECLVRQQPPKIFGSKGFEENDFRICHIGNPKRPRLSAPQHRSPGCFWVSSGSFRPLSFALIVRGSRAQWKIPNTMLWSSSIVKYTAYGNLLKRQRRNLL